MTTDTKFEIKPVTIVEVLLLRDRILRETCPRESDLRRDGVADTPHLGSLFGQEFIDQPASVSAVDGWPIVLGRLWQAM